VRPGPALLCDGPHSSANELQLFHMTAPPCVIGANMADGVTPISFRFTRSANVLVKRPICYPHIHPYFAALTVPHSTAAKKLVPIGRVGTGFPQKLLRWAGAATEAA
jgi:hypothetical protein